MPDEPTKTKVEANYRSLAYQRHCIDCRMFRDPNACTLVQGFIASNGTCQFWQRKKDK